MPNNTYESFVENFNKFLGNLEKKEPPWPVLRNKGKDVLEKIMEIEKKLSHERGDSWTQLNAVIQSCMQQEDISVSLPSEWNNLQAACSRYSEKANAYHQLADTCKKLSDIHEDLSKFKESLKRKSPFKLFATEIVNAASGLLRVADELTKEDISIKEISKLNTLLKDCINFYNEPLNPEKVEKIENHSKTLGPECKAAGSLALKLLGWALFGIGCLAIPIFGAGILGVAFGLTMVGVGEIGEKKQEAKILKANAASRFKDSIQKSQSMGKESIPDKKSSKSQASVQQFQVMKEALAQQKNKPAGDSKDQNSQPAPASPKPPST